MNYRLDSEQGMLQDAARNFFEKEVNGDLIRELERSETGFDRELWNKMAELGWMGLTIPEAYDGYETSFTHLAVVLEELGRSGLASPFFYTVALGSEMIKAFGSEEQQATILPRIVSGEMILSVAYAGADEPVSAADIPVRASFDGNGFQLDGCCMMVPFAHIADHIICATQSADGGTSLFLLASKTPGLTISPLQTSAQDRQCELLFEGVKLERSSLLGEEGQSWPVLQHLLRQAAVAKCAELVGGARTAMEMTVAYSKERVQFGRPIGAFQAVQHHCANMLTNLDSSALITRHTCKQVSAGTASVADMAKCKAWVSDACRRLLLLAHQVYAGMGFMEESDLQIYFRRTKAAEQIFGNSSFHREIVAREMGL